MGRQSYRSHSHTPVFSHNELLVAQPEKLELCHLSTASEDMAKLSDLEENLQLSLRQKVGTCHVCVSGHQLYIYSTLIQHTRQKFTHSLTHTYTHTHMCMHGCLHTHTYIHTTLEFRYLTPDVLNHHKWMSVDHSTSSHLIACAGWHIILFKLHTHTCMKL